MGGLQTFSVVTKPYLFIINTPYFVNSKNEVFIERTWYHDLIQHLRYLPNFTLAAPRRPMPADVSMLVPIDERTLAQLKLVALPSQAPHVRALVQLLPTFSRIWRAVGQAEIVHTAIVGSPYPLGWLASLVALIRGKKLLIIVESAPWRAARNDHATALWKKVLAQIYEHIARYFCSRADLSFYTQPAYLERYHKNGKGPAYIAPATWINDEDILDEAQARLLWDTKIEEPVRFLFAGRLVVEKGVRILLDAVEKLTAAGIRGTVHIIGEGPLREIVRSAERTAPFGLAYLEPVPYGAPFLNLLQQYHVLIVPSLGDEQPRIVFDAAARAVPVLASDTDGIRPHVENGHTGGLVPPGDSRALAEAIASWSGNPTNLRSYGMEALTRVRNKTHRAMHAERSQIIARHIG